MAFLQILVAFSALAFSTVSAGDCLDGFESRHGSCYLFSHGKESWIGAYESCKFFGAMLVEVDDAIEDNYILGRVSSLGGTWWTGLTDKLVEGEYVWETSMTVVTPGVSYTNWGDDEPNNSHEENCMAYDDDSPHKWKDTDCFHYNHYICEASQGGVQVVG